MTTSEELQRAFGYLWAEEVAALKELARSLPANPVVVNIGAGAGTSGLAFMESRTDLILHTVDIQADDSPLGCLIAEENALKAAGLWKLVSSHSFYGERNYQHWGDSKKMGESLTGFLNNEGFYWPPYKGQLEHKVNLVFVDGDHSYEGARGDIEAWLPNIKPGGIIAIHDYHKDELYESATDYHAGAPHPQDWPGVTRAVDELLTGKYERVMLVKSLIAFRVIE